MGIREKLNENPQITTAVTGGIIAVAIMFMLYQALFSGPSSSLQTEQFYTVDDGKTWFADSINMVAPFQKDGKEAVRIYLWTCDEGATKPFVTHLERYTPEAKAKFEQIQKLQNAKARPTAPQDLTDYASLEQLQYTGLQVKRPGDANWVSGTDKKSMDIRGSVNCPDGQQLDNLRPWTPDDE